MCIDNIFNLAENQFILGIMNPQKKFCRRVCDEPVSYEPMICGIFAYWFGDGKNLKFSLNTIYSA